MSREQLLERLRSDVRSLLVSSKAGVAPEQLRKDYLGMVGHPLPLRALGFRDVLDMAKEMADVVSFSFLEDGSIVLQAVSDDSTRRIQELVSRQNSCKNKTKRRQAGFFSSRGPSPRCWGPAPRWGRTPPALPVQLRTQLRMLLSQGPLSLSELEVRFLRCFGRPLRVGDLGFFSVGEMLEVAGDLVQVQQGRRGSVLSLKTPTPPPKTRPIKPTRPDGTRTPWSMSPGPETQEAPAPLSVYQNCSATSCRPLPSGSQRIVGNKHGELGRHPVPEPVQDGLDFKKSLIQLEAELRQRILAGGDAGSVSPELKAKLQKVVGHSEQGLSVHRLPVEYKREFGEDLPTLQSGFLSVLELVGALSDIFHLQPAGGNEDRHWIVRDINSVSQPGPEESGADVKPPCGSFYLSSGGSPWEAQQDLDVDHDSETITLSTPATLQKVPEVYPLVRVHPNSAVPLDAMRGLRLKPPTLRPAFTLAAVLVEQVESPSNFYIHFSGSQEARGLEDMMLEMRSCYTCPEVSDRYRLPQRFVRRGQVCCVAPRLLWFYRVVVHRLLAPEQVEVYYVDYGDLSVVSTHQLKFLKSCYSQLPAQAVPSALAGVQPSNGAWSAVAIASFRQLCCERPLMAVLHGYHVNVLQLSLCDTHTEDDLYVHRVLQEQQHATNCSPSHSATFCVQSNPVSLYLGEGLFEDDKEEEGVEEEARPTTQQPAREQQCLKDEAFPEMPDLEPVEVQSLNPGVLESECSLREQINVPPKPVSSQLVPPPSTPGYQDNTPAGFSPEGAGLHLDPSQPVTPDPCSTPALASPAVPNLLTRVWTWVTSRPSTKI